MASGVYGSIKPYIAGRTSGGTQSIVWDGTVGSPVGSPTPSENGQGGVDSKTAGASGTPTQSGAQSGAASVTSQKNVSPTQSGGPHSGGAPKGQANAMNGPGPNGQGIPPNGQPSNPFGGNFVNDNNPALNYTGLWTLKSGNPNGLSQTTHSARKQGSQVSFAFNGTKITVAGIVPGTNSTTTPAAATYSIDGGTPFLSILPLASESIPNQAFFASETLSPTQHVLVINVTETSPGSPYILDYFAVMPFSPQEAEASSAASQILKVKAGAARVEKIVGATLGVFGFIVIVALSLFLYRRRQQRQRLLQRQNYPDYLRPSNPVNPRTTMFTPTETIMSAARRPAPSWIAPSFSFGSEKVVIDMGYSTSPTRTNSPAFASHRPSQFSDHTSSSAQQSRITDFSIAPALPPKDPRISPPETV